MSNGTLTHHRCGQVAVTRKQDKRPDGSIVITTTVKEDVRLAAVVRTISLECTLAPRGAYRRSVAGLVEPSRLFDGLSSADAARLQSYLKVGARSWETRRDRGAYVVSILHVCV